MRRVPVFLLSIYLMSPNFDATLSPEGPYQYSMLTVSFYQTISGTLAFIPLAFIERGKWQLPSRNSWMILNEQIHVKQLLGGIIVIAGVALSMKTDTAVRQDEKREVLT